MKNTDNEKISALLRKDSLEDLIAVLSDPCDGCEIDQNTSPCSKGCGYLEQEGLQIGPNHALKELKRRKEIIDAALKRKE